MRPINDGLMERRARFQRQVAIAAALSTLTVTGASVLSHQSTPFRQTPKRYKQPPHMGVVSMAGHGPKRYIVDGSVYGIR